MCVVNAEAFNKDPNKYFKRAEKETVTVVTGTKRFFILDEKELERLELDTAFAESDADIAEGRVLTQEQMNVVFDELINDAKARSAK